MNKLWRQTYLSHSFFCSTWACIILNRIRTEILCDPHPRLLTTPHMHSKKWLQIKSTNLRSSWGYFTTNGYILLFFYAATVFSARSFFLSPSLFLLLPKYLLSLLYCFFFFYFPPRFLGALTHSHCVIEETFYQCSWYI